MKRKFMTCLTFILCLTLSFSVSTHVLAGNGSLSKKSDQWQVKISELKTENPNHVFNPYSIAIKNIGDHVSKVEVTGYRDLADVQSNVVTSLADKGLAKGYAIKSKFPLHVKAHRLVVLLSWTEGNSEKEHREMFVFNR